VEKKWRCRVERNQLGCKLPGLECPRKESQGKTAPDVPETPPARALRQLVRTPSKESEPGSVDSWPGSWMALTFKGVFKVSDGALFAIHHGEKSTLQKIGCKLQVESQPVCIDWQQDGIIQRCIEIDEKRGIVVWQIEKTQFVWFKTTAEWGLYSRDFTWDGYWLAFQRWPDLDVKDGVSSRQCATFLDEMVRPGPNFPDGSACQTTEAASQQPEKILWRTAKAKETPPSRKRRLQ